VRSWGPPKWSIWRGRRQEEETTSSSLLPSALCLLPPGHCLLLTHPSEVANFHRLRLKGNTNNPEITPTHHETSSSVGIIAEEIPHNTNKAKISVKINIKPENFFIEIVECTTFILPLNPLFKAK
jgi:hypothetical protein